MKNKLTIDNVNFLEVFSTYFYLKNYNDTYKEEEIIEKTSKIKKEIIEKYKININDALQKYAALKEFIRDTIKSDILI